MLQLKICLTQIRICNDGEIFPHHLSRSALIIIHLCSLKLVDNCLFSDYYYMHVRGFLMAYFIFHLKIIVYLAPNKNYYL